MPELETPPVVPETPVPPVDGAPAGETPVNPETPPAPAAEAPAAPESVVPEAYDLKLPDGSTLDPAIVERTAARARALGLSNEAGQQLLDQTVQDLADAETKANADAQAFADAWKPGGAEWTKRNDEWTKAALADPEIGGSSDKLATAIEHGQRALTKYGTELKAYLDETGMGSHPAAIKFFARIGKAMSEGEYVPGAHVTTKPKSDAQMMYPNDYNDDGTPKKPQ